MFTQDNDGYTYFTSGGGGPGHGQNTFRPDEWQSTGGSGGSKSFSFSFGGSGGPGSFGFGLNDIFSNFFGGDTKGGVQFGGFGGSTRTAFSVKDLGIYPRRAPGVFTMVQDVTDLTVRRPGVDALPAIVGWLSNGEKHVLKTGISVKDIKSAVNDLSIYIRLGFLRNHLQGNRIQPSALGILFPTLLDATKQSAFLNAFDKAGFKSVDKLLVAYKPR
uniref:Uncharacterized protein n=1 Tax=Quercus lobata TaxID=97700 RepID=A0A7N2M5M0_QUELO